MKVLKKPDTNWSYKYTCTNCTAELEIEKTDIKNSHYPGDCRGEPAYDSWSTNCPICSKGISIPENAIPKAVQVEIKRGFSRGNSSYFDK
jgi:hypothetical protein